MKEDAQRAERSAGRHGAVMADHLGQTAAAIADDVIAELFGDRQAGPGEGPGRDRRWTDADARPIYDLLASRYERFCSGTDPQALSPSPLVNRALNRLVRIICRPGSADHPSGPMAIGHLRLQQEVIVRVLQRVSDDRELGRQARILKAIACAAEAEMESSYGDQILERLAREDRIDLAVWPSAGPCAERERNASDQPSARHGRHDERIDRLEKALRPFPYVQNYRHMAAAEIDLLGCAFTPLFVRDCRLRQVVNDAPFATIARLRNLCRAGLATTCGLSASPFDRQQNAGLTIAVGGSGAMPLSGLMLHLLADATIILIDRDPSAVRRSTQLIAHLGRLGILRPKAFTVVEADIADVRFRRTDRPKPGAVACDVVLLASLLSAAAKQRVADSFCLDPDAPEWLLVRSATGLSALLAYDAVATESLGDLALAYSGMALPASQLAVDAGGHVMLPCHDDQDLLVLAHPDMINSTEIYRRLPLPIAGRSLNLSSCATMSAIEQSLGRGAALMAGL